MYTLICIFATNQRDDLANEFVDIQRRLGWTVGVEHEPNVVNHFVNALTVVDNTLQCRACRATAGAAPRASSVSTSARLFVHRPRVRSLDGREIPLPTWTAAQAEDWLGRWAVNLMLINVSTRKLRRAVRLPKGDVPAIVGDGTSSFAALRFPAHGLANNDCLPLNACFCLPQLIAARGADASRRYRRSGKPPRPAI